MIYHPPPPTRPHPGTTPEPEYGNNDFRGTSRPETIPTPDLNRARRARQAAIQCYPGVVGEVLANELRAYEDLGWLASPSSPIRQLIDELLGE